MKRRTFIAFGGLLPMGSGFGFALPGARGLLADVAVADLALPEADLLVSHAARFGMPFFDFDSGSYGDVSALWYGSLEARFLKPDSALRLVGVVRNADFFVLSRLAGGLVLPGGAVVAYNERVGGSVVFCLQRGHPRCVASI